MRNVILSCYLTSGVDPQRNVKHAVRAESMRVWDSSAASAVPTASRVVIHDDASGTLRAEFPDTYFVYERIMLGGMSLNDVRMILFIKYLVKNPHIDYVLITDIFDVEFYSSPFTIFDEGKLYIGSNDTWAAKPKQIPRLRGIPTAREPEFYMDKPLLNPGIIGGDHATVLRFLCDMLPIINTTYNDNMPVTNVVGYSPAWTDKIITGYPLHTQFKKFEPASCGAFIRHK